MTVNLTIASYVIFAIVAYYAILFVMSRVRPEPPELLDRVAELPLIVILVPALNEELVLEATLSNLTGLSYAAEYRVLVINDASTDATGAIAHRVALADHRVRVLDRSPAESGTGKSAVLNAAFFTVKRWCAEGEEWLGGRTADEIVLAIVDADGRLEPAGLGTVAPYFADPSVGTVQIGVRIINADEGVLTRMQDMEFVGFSWLVQVARDRFGSSGLGGNGQFTRLSALSSLGGAPWSEGALTEDLDLGLRLVEAGWRTRFCYGTYVGQQGLDRWKPLLRQRTRWIQGHYQCWRHIGPLLGARRARLASRIDLVVYLVLVVTVVLVSATVALGFAASLGAVTVTNNFLSFVPPGIWRRSVSLCLSVLPVVVFMVTYQRHATRPFRWFEVPTFAVVFTLYTYVWLLTTLRAWTRILLRRNGWVKTPRVGVIAS